jgi:hypothetical protein
MYNAAKAGRLQVEKETALERTISWGSTAFFWMLLYWIFSGAWLI